MVSERKVGLPPEIGLAEARIEKVKAEMRKHVGPALLGGVASQIGEVQSPVRSMTSEFAAMHYAPKSDPNASAHSAAHEYETVVENSERQIAAWKKEARRKGVEWSVFREQLLDNPHTRTIVMREGAGPGAFARVVETDRPLTKRGHSDDDDKANEIGKKIREADNLIWYIARQLRD